MIQGKNDKDLHNMVLNLGMEPEEIKKLGKRKGRNIEKKRKEKRKKIKKKQRKNKKKNLKN